MAVAAIAAEGLEIRNVSRDSENYVWSIVNTTESGSHLSIELEVEKNGELMEGFFTVPRNTDFPFTPDMIMQIWVSGSHKFTGYVEARPEIADDLVLEVRLLGFAQKMNRINVNETYTSQTIKQILDDLGSNYFGDSFDIFYTAANAVPPSYTVSNIAFEDVSLWDAIESLMEIANTAYGTTEYHFGIDKDREFFFKTLDIGTVQDYFYEGYNFQDPEVEQDTGDIVNEVYTYRAKSTDKNSIEFVNSYADSNSQGNYGIRDKKFTFPSYTDSTTMQRIANYYLNRFKDPITTYEIENFIVDDILDFGQYKLNSRLDNRYRFITQCEDVSEWDQTGITATSIAVTSDNFLTGRKSLKCTTASGSAGEYISYTLDAPIPFPKQFRFFTYMEDAAGYTVEICDTDSNLLTVYIVGTFDAAMKVNDGGTYYALKVNVGGTDYVLKSAVLRPGVVDSWLKIIVDISGLKNIAEIKITFNDDTATNIYFDYFDCLTRSWETYTLGLQRVSYEMSKNVLIANAEFGDYIPTLADKMKEKVKDGDTALSVFSKQ